MATAISSTATAKELQYPAAPQSATVDEYFGIKVADPYRPLENDTAASTAQWVEAENALTNAYLSQIPYRSKIKERLTRLNNYRKTGLPSREKDGKYYYYENDGLRNQSVLYRKDKLDGKAEVFLDPNTLSDDGTVALQGITFSNDGKYAAYIISRNGSDWTEIYVMDVATKQLLPDHLEWTKFTGASWHKDGFYYSAYDRPEAGKEFSNANENHRVYYHRLGTPQSADQLVYSDPANPLHFHSVWVPEDESMILLYGSGEGSGNSLMAKTLTDPNADWVVFEGSQADEIMPIEVVDGTVYMITSKDAPRYRLVTATLDRPTADQWADVVPQGKSVLTGAQFAGDNIIATYNQDASTHAYLYDKSGKLICEIQFPTYGTAGFSSDRKHDEVFYSFRSFVYPNATFSYDMASGESKMLNTPEIDGFNPADYMTEQIFYPSADGTRIPMYITYKKGLKLDGQNPTYLYGYGGFNVNLDPGFAPNRILWLENGGVYAQPNLRGGGEYGEEWHIAGTKMNKLNVFNDFIAAAEYLIDKGYTNPEKLVIVGGSNGGLLVGATTNMRPDLFKVAIPQVGVMDMMRYHLFTIGWNWAPDYGTSADSPEMAKYLLGYSPTHNIKNDGTPYPAILVTTADHDDRVVPAHSFKYAATLQSSDTGDAPKLIRIDSKAGHGGGKPISKVIDEYADIYSFIFHNMGVTPVETKE